MNFPAIAFGFGQLTSEVEKMRGLSHRARQVVILTVAGHLNAAYELYAHFAVGADAGLTASQIATLCAGGRATDLGVEESLAAEVATALLRGGVLPAPIYEAVITALGQDALDTIVFVTIVYLAIGCMLNAYDVGPGEPTSWVFRAVSEGEKRSMYDKVTWPDGYGPDVSAIYALNDIDVKAPPEVVWKLLVDAENWSSYFPPENQVRILGDDSELRSDTKFTRVTVGIPMSLTVTEYDPVHRLSWKTVVDGAPDSTAYHGWVLTPTTDGCHVLSEETQQGSFFLEELGRKHPGALYSYHQDWVERLARAAESKSLSPR